MEKILILDFGSQYTQLIARRVREAKVFSELHPWDMTEDAIREFKPSGIILSGGPNSVYEQQTPQAPDVVFELGVPVLGICYGMQTMAAQLGGTVEPVKHANLVMLRFCPAATHHFCAALKIRKTVCSMYG